MSGRRGPIRVLALSTLLFGVIVLAAPFLGREPIRPSEAFGPEGTTRFFIFWTLRVPRLLLGLLAGASLSLAGLAFQTLFRNPLATPFTLGVSSGAAFGAALAVMLRLEGTLLGIDAAAIAALAGAVLVVFFLYALARRGGGLSTLHLLLAGVAISYFFSALLLFLQYTADFTETFRVVRWLMGRLESIGYNGSLTILPAFLLGVAFLFLYRREMDLMLTGDEIARSRGVPVDRIRVRLFLVASFLTATTVASCGPIGFVGLVVPHALRMLVGLSHGALIAGCVLVGGPFLVVCDVIARSIVPESELPVGIVTALLGGPFFLWLVIRRRD
ncbi:MAG: iron ABC transporter permease [Candidatus Latescibacterota bacterium]|nr:MAG: iron ABC transporter permease [Candidatus Latescibacterota bacterium]